MLLWVCVVMLALSATSSASFATGGVLGNAPGQKQVSNSRCRSTFTLHCSETRWIKNAGIVSCLKDLRRLCACCGGLYRVRSRMFGHLSAYNIENRRSRNNDFGINWLPGARGMPVANKRNQWNCCVLPIAANPPEVGCVNQLHVAVLRLAVQNTYLAASQVPAESSDAQNSCKIQTLHGRADCKNTHFLDERERYCDLSAFRRRLQKFARSLVSQTGIGKSLCATIRSAFSAFRPGYGVPDDGRYRRLYTTARHSAESLAETVAGRCDASSPPQCNHANTSSDQYICWNSQNHIWEVGEHESLFDEILMNGKGPRRMHIGADEQYTRQYATLSADSEFTYSVNDEMHLKNCAAEENCFSRNGNSNGLVPGVKCSDNSLNAPNAASGSSGDSISRLNRKRHEDKSYVEGSASLRTIEGHTGTEQPEEVFQIGPTCETKRTIKADAIKCEKFIPVAEQTTPGSDYIWGTGHPSAVVNGIEGPLKQFDTASLESGSQQLLKHVETSGMNKPSQPACIDSKNQRGEAACFSYRDLSEDVANVFLAALRGPSSKQALAVRTLTSMALLNGTLKYFDISEHHSNSSRMQLRDYEGFSCVTSELLERLLRKGLLASLYRVLNMPTSRSFWPRWWHRDAQATLRKHVDMLKCQIDCIRLLELVVCLTKDGLTQVTANKDLMKVLQRIRALPTRSSQRDNSSRTELQHEQPLLADDLSESASPSLPTGGICESGTMSDVKGVMPCDESLKTYSDRRNQGQDDTVCNKDANVQRRPYLPPIEYQMYPVTTGEKPRISDHHARDGDKQERSCLSASQDSPLAFNENRQSSSERCLQPSSSVVTPENTCSQASSLISKKVEFLQSQRAHVLRRQLEQATSHFLERLMYMADNTAHQDRLSGGDTEGTYAKEIDETTSPRLWWPSFLSRHDYQVSPSSGGTDGFLREVPCQNLLQTYGVKRQFAPVERAKERGIAYSRLGNFVQRILRAIPTCNGSQYVNRREISAKPESNVVWIPVNINAGDAALWAAIASVAGEGLAHAIKRNFSSSLVQANSREHVTGMEPLGSASDFVSFLNQVRINHPEAGDAPSNWSFLVVLLEHGQGAKGTGKEVSNKDRSYSTIYGNTAGNNTAVDDDPRNALSGTFEFNGEESHFRVLSLINGGTVLQEYAKKLGVKALESAATTGSAETATHALRALTALVRRHPETTTDLIMPLLESISVSKKRCVPSVLEHALANAIIAPYSTSWLQRVTSEEEVPRVVKDSLQLAALEFLYTVCMHRENYHRTLGTCSAIKAALNRVIRVCAASRASPKTRDDLPVNDYVEKGVSEVERAYDKLFANVDTLLPPSERHLKVLQEHARPLRLATVVAAALGMQRKWKPRTAGQKGLRILALDGGGTRGVLTVSLLKHIAVAAGKELSEMFDIICGTSTGGIIAVLLGMEKASTVELEMLYDTLIKEVFVKDSAAVAGARLVVRQAYYDERLWESLLERAFSDARMIDFAADESMPKVFCLSSKISSSPAKVVVWRNYNYPSDNGNSGFPPSWLGRLMQHFIWKKAAPCSNRDRKEIHRSRYEGSCCVRVRDALRATTAAPGFFIGKTIGEEFFVDGALLANNPAAVAIAEARALYPGVPIEVVVSVGTGKCAPERVDPSKIGWDGILNQLVNAATNTEAVHEILNELLPRSVYFRFNPEIETSSIDETSKDRLDELKHAAKRFFEDEHNKRQLQRLAGILQSKSPVEKCARGLSRLFAARAKSFSHWLAHIKNQFCHVLHCHALLPLRSADSGLVRLAKCLVGTVFRGSAQRSKSSSGNVIRDEVAEISVHNLSATDDAASDTAFRHISLDSYADLVEPQYEQSETTKVFPGSSRTPDHSDGGLRNNNEGNRRSFWAWLLNSSQPKLASQTRGVFDILEIHGRRRLSKLRKQQEHETLVPHTGVRHVLHGIFEQMRGGP